MPMTTITAGAVPLADTVPVVRKHHRQDEARQDEAQEVIKTHLPPRRSDSGRHRDVQRPHRGLRASPPDLGRVAVPERVRLTPAAEAGPSPSSVHWPLLPVPATERPATTRRASVQGVCAGMQSLEYVSQFERSPGQTPSDWHDHYWLLNDVGVS